MLLGIPVYRTSEVESFKNTELEGAREKMRKKWQDEYAHQIYFVALLVVTAITVPLVFEKTGLAVSLLCDFVAIPPVSALRKKRYDLMQSVSWKVSVSSGRVLLTYADRIPSVVRSHVEQIIGNTYGEIGIDPRVITFEYEYLDADPFLWVSIPETNCRHTERYCIAHWDQSTAHTEANHRHQLRVSETNPSRKLHATPGTKLRKKKSRRPLG